jgi:Skp family chaperone for outer membrane proteins
MSLRSRIFLGTVATLLLAAQNSFAQVAQSYPTYNDSPQVVSVNRERLIQNSAFGRALIASLSTKQTALVEENETLAQNLEREELELTELRKSLTSDVFSPLAEAFDVKVKEVRRVQDQKAIDLAKLLEGARFRFFRQAERVIAQLMKENGIVFVLDESAVWISQGGDVTNVVIERLDSAYEAGELAFE